MDLKIYHANNKEIDPQTIQFITFSASIDT